MIRSICSVCKIQYGTKPDGRAEVRDSHGYCLKCASEAMADIERQFTEMQQAEARMAAA
jgi:hypothetical protein